ncbi:hypothetical protein BDZ94DRAFT_1248286 [Collybia nuda]|uniref:Uncharacterized protein n=1 Tax=Collybia nuda TaxID=64659 RepID=A0A9P6CP07_9AGAR|nr:hypothetical protein BDZ94DRAFT_1248286 [Collybia nuda]
MLSAWRSARMDSGSGSSISVGAGDGARADVWLDVGVCRRSLVSIGIGIEGMRGKGGLGRTSSMGILMATLILWAARSAGCAGGVLVLGGGSDDARCI